MQPRRWAVVKERNAREDVPWQVEFYEKEEEAERRVRQVNSILGGRVVEAVPDSGNLGMKRRMPKA